MENRRLLATYLRRVVSQTKLSRYHFVIEITSPGLYRVYYKRRPKWDFVQNLGLFGIDIEIQGAHGRMIKVIGKIFDTREKLTVAVLRKFKNGFFQLNKLDTPRVLREIKFYRPTYV